MDSQPGAYMPCIPSFIGSTKSKEEETTTTEMTERGSEGVSEEMRVAFRFRLQASERAAVCSGEMDGWIDGHSSQRTACFSASTQRHGDRGCGIVVRGFIELDRQVLVKFFHAFLPISYD